MTTLRPAPGFDWRRVTWGRPDSVPTAICSYCAGALPQVPLILFTDKDYTARFCDACAGDMTERRASLSPRLRAPPLKEIDIHLAVASLLAKAIAPGWEYTHIPLGGKREVQTASLLQRMGTKPGWPDFALFGPLKSVYFLELKTLTGPLEESQAILFPKLRAMGFEVAVARSPEQATIQLARWGAIRVDYKQLVERTMA